MKAKALIAGILTLAVAFLVPACSRNGVDEPNPTGPSTYAIVLKVTAASNTILAGDSRGSTAINATLKKFDGTPLSNRTVFFELVKKDLTTKEELGYLEETGAVTQAKTTDSGGNVSSVYFGPTAEELSSFGVDDTSIYVKLTCSLENNNFVSDYAQIDIVSDNAPMTGTLAVVASPNSVYAGTQREPSNVIAKLTDSNGAPLAGKKLFFEIFNSDQTVKSTLGYFAGNLAVVERITDSSGFASVTYYGPTAAELTKQDLENTTVNIKVTASEYLKDGVPYSEFAPINIISDSSYIIIASSSPGTIMATDARGKTTIQASLRKRDGTSLGGKRLIFEIFQDAEGTTKSDFGFFEGNTTVKTVTTDGGGNAKVVYYGPTSSEIEYFAPPDPTSGEDPGNPKNQTVYIRVTAAVERPDSKESVFENARVDVICEPVKYVVELRAYPAVLLAGTTRQASDIVMTVKRNSKVVTGKKAYFLVQSPALGYFKDTKTVQSQDVLDGNGQAKVVYLGPLSAELGAEEVGVIIEGRFVIDTKQPPTGSEGPPQYKRTVYIHVVKQR